MAKHEEQETTINIYRDEPLAKIYTSDPTIESTLDRMCKKYPGSYELISENEYGAFYKMDKKLLFRAPRTCSDEQREASAARMRELHQKLNYDTADLEHTDDE